MSAPTVISILLLGFIGISQGKIGFRGNQEWGFVEVRPGATMFYWLHYTTANGKYTQRPLIIWLQGGPGTSSTAFGNFEEIGPSYRNMTERENTLIKDYNVLFIDSPVGTGYSNVKSNEALSKTDLQVAKDLLNCIDQFFKRFPRFSEVPTYIIGESYGGKSATMLAYLWSQVRQGSLKTNNLKGVGLIDPWISPIDTVLSWAQYLFQNGFVDTQGYEEVMHYVNRTRDDIIAKNWKRATNNGQITLRKIIHTAKNLNVYNILTKVEGNYADPFFQVEYLLNNTNLTVFIFNGQLDLIVNTPGTLHWIENLNWKYATNWSKARRNPVFVNNFIEGYVKAYENLNMYWVNRAGHMVPSDNLAAMEKILQEVTER